MPAHVFGFSHSLRGGEGGAAPGDPLSPRRCREFTPNPADPGSRRSVPIGRLRGAPMQVRRGMQQDADSKLPGCFGALSCYPLAVPPQARCFLLGRCWIAQVCSAGSRCSLGIGVARSLSGASPGDTAGPGAAWLSPGGAQHKPVDTKFGGKDGSCPDVHALLLRQPLSVSDALPGHRERGGLVWWRLCSGYWGLLCLGLATVLCRATAAGLTSSGTEGGFQEGKTLCLNIYTYICLLFWNFMAKPQIWANRSSVLVQKNLVYYHCYNMEVFDDTLGL